jgi:hypothetical protein
LWAFHFSKRGLEKIIRNTSVFSRHATSPALRRYPKSLRHRKQARAKKKRRELWKFPLMDHKLLFFYNNSTVIPHS